MWKASSFYIVLISLIVLLATLFISGLNLHQTCTRSRIKYWPYLNVMWNPNDNLRSMKRVFNRFGCEMVNGSLDDSWDVLWAVEYPFDQLPEQMRQLKPQHRVNHIPGINFITYKAFMVTNNHFDFIPAAFEFPRMIEAFKIFSDENPSTRFVVKNGENRGVKLVTIEEMDFSKQNGQIYQAFIENPLLIDDRAFDLGVYALITSINPLRIYRFKGEVLLRFCPEPYYPFDPSNINKYVVYETQQTIFEMPSLRELVKTFGFSFRAAFENNLRSRGYDPDELWYQIDDAIVTLISANEKNFIDSTKEFAADSGLFFELVRFDFIIGDDFKVHLMEVNMSPNLTPSNDRFEGHALGYEQVVFHALRCAVGIDFAGGSGVHAQDFKNLAVDYETCTSKNCKSNCESPQCDFCACCITETNLKHIRKSYVEHQQRGEMKRIFPAPPHFEETFLASTSPSNQLMARWFQKKCENDVDWC